MAELDLALVHGAHAPGRGAVGGRRRPRRVERVVVLVHEGRGRRAGGGALGAEAEAVAVLLLHSPPGPEAGAPLEEEDAGGGPGGEEL